MSGIALPRVRRKRRRRRPPSPWELFCIAFAGWCICWMVYDALQFWIQPRVEDKALQLGLCVFQFAIGRYMPPRSRGGGYFRIARSALRAWIWGEDEPE